MNDERMRILNMLAEGKVTAAEAASLLDAVRAAPDAGGQGTSPSGAPRYMRVLVEDPRGEQGARVNVRVPFALLRAGVRLAALLPPGVNDQINAALKQNGVDIDVSRIKPENLEELVSNLGELTVDVQGNRGEKVRVFCE